MLSYDQIEDAAKDYKKLTLEQLDGIETEELHKLQSQLIAKDLEINFSKKSFVGAANEVLKDVRHDIAAINGEIQRRNERSRPKPNFALEGAS